MGSAVTSLSILAAVTCWGLALVQGPVRARLAWTIGLACYVVHILAAFATFYQWSHATALAETARQTAEVTGFATSVGLWVNHAFTGVLALDVLQQWCSGRRRWASAIDAFVLFMIINGTVVFAEGAVRIYGLLLTGLVITLRMRRRRFDGSEHSARVAAWKSSGSTENEPRTHRRETHGGRKG